MSLQSRLKFPVPILLLAAVLLCGCGTFSNMKKSTENMVRDFRAPDTDLKKTVFRLPLDNQVAAAKQDMGETIDGLYRDDLPISCPGLLLVETGDSEASQALKQIFEKGGPIDSLALVRIGKQAGISAIVNSHFYAVAIRKQDTGYLWFLKKHPFAWISASTEVYDSETGAKYLDQTFTRELKLNEEEAESIQSGNISSVPHVEKAVFEIMQQMADSVCDALIRKPWKGYVAKVSGDTLTLSSGSRTGLAAGRLLKVYAPGSKIQGADGQTFLLPGKKIGEIKIMSVSDDSAEAVALSGSGFEPDDVVKTR